MSTITAESQAALSGGLGWTRDICNSLPRSYSTRTRATSSG